MTAPAKKAGTPVRVLTVAAAAFAVLTGGLFLLLFERVEDSEAVGPSGRALRDRYWASTLLLEQMGVPTSVRYGLGHLPAPQDNAVVIVLASDYEHRQTLAERLLPWVEQGGHLVITPSPESSGTFTEFFDPDPWNAPPTGDNDPLFYTFGIPIHTPEQPAFGTDALVEVATDDSTGTVRALVTRSRLGVGQAPCEAVVGTARSTDDLGMESDIRLQLRSECGWGAGLVTALSSDDLLHNDHLRDERGDNAAFFWESVAPELRGEAPSQAIFVLRGEAPSFLSLLWNRAWPVLTSLGLLLLAWARFAGQRFGVRVDRPQLARRSMLEHLDAAGSLLWRAGRRGSLVAPMRAAVRSRLARRMPALAHLRGQALAEAAAEATGRPVAVVHMALVAPPPEDRPGFVRMTQVLQSMWRDA